MFHFWTSNGILIVWATRFFGSCTVRLFWSHFYCNLPSDWSDYCLQQGKVQLRSTTTTFLVVNTLMLTTPFKALAETCEADNSFFNMPLLLFVALIGATVGGNVLWTPIVTSKCFLLTFESFVHELARSLLLTVECQVLKLLDVHNS